MKLLNTFCKENPMPDEINLTAAIFRGRRYLINSRRREGIFICTGILSNGFESWMKINHYKVRTKYN